MAARREKTEAEKERRTGGQREYVLSRLGLESDSSHAPGAFDYHLPRDRVTHRGHCRSPVLQLDANAIRRSTCSTTLLPIAASCYSIRPLHCHGCYIYIFLIQHGACLEAAFRLRLMRLQLRVYRRCFAGSVRSTQKSVSLPVTFGVMTTYRYTIVSPTGGRRRRSEGTG